MVWFSTSCTSCLSGNNITSNTWERLICVIKQRDVANFYFVQWIRHAVVRLSRQRHMHKQKWKIDFLTSLAGRCNLIEWKGSDFSNTVFDFELENRCPSSFGFEDSLMWNLWEWRRWNILSEFPHYGRVQSVQCALHITTHLGGNILHHLTPTCTDYWLASSSLQNYCRELKSANHCEKRIFGTKHIEMPRLIL